VQGHTRGILDAKRGPSIRAPLAQLVVAGAYGNRTHRGSFEPQTVLKTAQATRPDPPPRAMRYPFIAITSISTRAAFGRPAACTVERAGLCVPKCFA
jgi:hypothetical protein